MPPITEDHPVRFSDQLPQSVDVVVIGGGVAGTASAYYLAERGQKVLLCEKGRIAGEQSSRNWGWICQQGRDHAELPIMMESNRIWQGLAEKTGDRDLSFTQTGCIYLAAKSMDMQKYERWYDHAKQHQLDTELLSPAQLQKRYPGISGNWMGAMVTPSDGRGEPFVAIPALARAAQRAGVAVAEVCAVRNLDLQDGRVSGVHTEKGRVACNRVVLAGGMVNAFRYQCRLQFASTRCSLHRCSDRKRKKNYFQSKRALLTSRHLALVFVDALTVVIHWLPAAMRSILYL